MGNRGKGALAASMLLAAGTTSAANLEFDIVVSGGSFSAVAAAFAAARENPSAQILLIEPTDWLGGQGTSQGVSAIDNAYHAPANSAMASAPELYYPADYLAFLDGMRNAPVEAPGIGYSGFSGWVSRDCYDPRTAAWVLDNQAATFSNLTVIKLAVVKDVTTSASETPGRLRIDSLSLIERTPANGYVPFQDFLSEEIVDWYSPTDSARFTKQTHTVVPRNATTGLVVIDASELGDVMVLSGARYTQGREVSTEKIAEDGTLPALNDGQPMAMVYPFAMTTSNVADTEAALKTPWPDFDAFLAERTANYFSLSSFTWTSVFTYRRLLANGSNNINSITAGDVSMQNWNPGNDYRQGPWLLDMAATNAEALADWQGGVNVTSLALAEQQAVAWYFWLKERRPGSVPGTDTRFLRGSDPLNMMGTEHGLAKFPYIRCTRRLVGLDNFRITGRYWVNTQTSSYANETSFRYHDSVGIGSYSSDVRPLLTSTGIAPPFGLPAPFYIPYRALASENVENLLAAGKTIAQTYVTNSAYRLHPIEWASGSAAGTAAAILIRDGLRNDELMSIPRLREYQALVATNAPIRWAYTGESVIPTVNGDLVVNDFQPLVAFDAFELELYHRTAVRAVVHVNNQFLDETTLRSNGRLLLQSTGVPFVADEYVFTVQALDAEGGVIDILETTVPSLGVSCQFEVGVTDNDDTDGFFTTVGSWTTATAQPDRWCPEREGGATYDITNSNDGLRRAEWRLRTTVPGLYRVEIWYPASSNRATDARFTVNHAEGSTPINVNQRINGGGWFALGEFLFNNNPGEGVVLRNNHSTSGDYVIADAVRVTLLEPSSGVGELWLIE